MLSDLTSSVSSSSDSSTTTRLARPFLGAAFFGAGFCVGSVSYDAIRKMLVLSAATVKQSCNQLYELGNVDKIVMTKAVLGLQQLSHLHERTSSFFCELSLPWLAFGGPPPKKLRMSAGMIILQDHCSEKTIDWHPL